MGKRADAVELLSNVDFVVEFKVGATFFDRAAREQVHDCSLDLKDFHKGSYNAAALSILITTNAVSQLPLICCWAHNNVAKRAPAALSSLIGIL